MIQFFVFPEKKKKTGHSASRVVFVVELMVRDYVKYLTTAE